MTPETKDKGEPKTKKYTFKCRFCEKDRPLSEMVVITKYFPPIVACRQCEKKLR